MFKKINLPPTVRSIGVALIIGFVSFWLANSLLFNLELFASDVLFRLRGEIEEESPVVLVAIDDVSFDQSGLQWPWPRNYFADIIDGISAGNPRVIAIDVIWSERSDPEEDAALARALGDAGNVVLVGQIYTDVRQGLRVSTLDRPIPEFSEVTTLGIANLPRDEDGTVRRVLAFQSHNDQLFYGWSMQSSRMFLGEDDFQIESRDKVFIGAHPVQLENQYLLVNFRGEPASTIPYVSAYQVAEGLIDPAVFEDKIVVIGATTETLHDTYPTRFIGDPPTPMPGAEINAHAMDTIINQRYVTRTDGWANLLVVLLMAAIATFVTLRLRPLPGLGATVLLSIIYGVAAALIFIQARLILPMVAPLLAFIGTFVANTSIQLYEEQIERARVRSLFDRYVSPDAIDQMLDHPEYFAQGGERKELTILFSDIRGFTSLSEQMTADEVVTILNEYLEAMTQIIFEHGGTIDKFLGDAILAIWNAPLDTEDYATRAVECALAMTNKLEEMQEKWAATGQVVLKTGTGITTGEVFVGNIGSSQRMDYTVIGDKVNLASRLEALTKEVGVSPLFNERTQELLDPQRIKARYVTAAQVKGKAEPVKIYTVDPGTHGLSTDVELDTLPEVFVQTKK